MSLPNCGDIYRSNNGKGSFRMQIVAVSREQVECIHLGRWKRRFSLPTWFLSNPSCGWKR